MKKARIARYYRCRDCRGNERHFALLCDAERFALNEGDKSRLWTIEPRY